ncbi:chorismate mutase [Methanobacterium sp. CWC-01]|jgi:chorismate mutase|uniref:chorismate mutase n=1 Tax=Methanobacterium aridiramus TaxID=2584467 RepID=UPI002577B16D|nr:chorismate mutase [Methanobacterium sp. CWC-01]WJI08844.1 chorismate mutase [Methanobacterium sp. CWC-01]
MDRVEALRRLEDSRRQIDMLDHEIIELIAQRTFLAGEIVQAKMVLDMEIEDKEREEYIQKKIREIAREKKIDPTSLSQIMKILTSLSKKEQKKILKR